MWISPTEESPQLVVPRPDPDGARAVAAGLGVVMAASAQAAGALERVKAQPEIWQGAACDLFDADRVDVTAELARLAPVLDRARRALLGWAEAVGPLVAELRAAAVQVEQTEGARRAMLGRGGWTPAVAQAATSARARWEAGVQAYARAQYEVVSVLHGVLDELPDRRPSLHDHVEGFGRALWRGAVADQVSATWSLSGAMFFDPERFVNAWAAVPGNLWENVRHPVLTLEDEVDADAWRRGRYGEGLGAVVAATLPWRRERTLLPRAAGGER